MVSTHRMRQYDTVLAVPQCLNLHTTNKSREADIQQIQPMPSSCQVEA